MINSSFLWKPKDKQSRHKYWSLVVMYPETINHRSAPIWHVSSRAEMSGIKQWTVNTTLPTCDWNGLESDSLLYLEASHTTCNIATRNTVGKWKQWMNAHDKGKMKLNPQSSICLLIFCRGTMKLKPKTNNLNILNLRPSASPGLRPCRGKGEPWARRPPGGPQPPSPSARGPSSLLLLLLHPLMPTPLGPRTRRPTKLWQVRSENFVTLCLFCSGGRAPLISQLSILMIILFQTQKFREPLIWGGSTLREAWKTPCRSAD